MYTSNQKWNVINVYCITSPTKSFVFNGNLFLKTKGKIDLTLKKVKNAWQRFNEFRELNLKVYIADEIYRT